MDRVVPYQDDRVFRVLFVTDGFEVGGAQNALLDLLRRMSPERYRRTVFSTGAEGLLTAAYRSACERLVSKPKRRPFDFALVRSLAAFEREERPHLIVSVLFYADVIAGTANLANRIPLVSWQHALPRRDLKNNRLRHRLAYRLVHPRFTRVVCCSNAVADDIAGLFGVRAKKMVTIWNAVDTRRFAFRALAPTPDGFAIGMVARFEPGKGHEILLRAFRRIREPLPQSHLHFFGDGSTRPSIESLAGDLGVSDHVTFHGMVADMEVRYADLDVVVLPSDSEACPLSLLEAMACGRPVIASDVPGAREIVEPGVTGLLCPAGDAEAFADAIAALAKDRGRIAAMGRAGRERVETRFNADRQFDSILRLLHETAGMPW
jgi:glycosyltransferase involved in cell wall biosynthesis